MGRTGRIALGVIAGAVLWAMLWVGGTKGAQAAWPEVLDPTQRLDHVGALTGYILYSVVLSVLAGFVAAAISRSAPMRAAWILAVIQLAIGIFTEVSFWNLLPVWYHLVFLALIIPATVYGGRLRAGG